MKSTVLLVILTVELCWSKSLLQESRTSVPSDDQDTDPLNEVIRNTGINTEDFIEGITNQLNETKTPHIEPTIVVTTFKPSIISEIISPMAFQKRKSNKLPNPIIPKLVIEGDVAKLKEKSLSSFSDKNEIHQSQKLKPSQSSSPAMPSNEITHGFLLIDGNFNDADFNIQDTISISMHNIPDQIELKNMKNLGDKQIKDISDVDNTQASIQEIIELDQGSGIINQNSDFIPLIVNDTVSIKLNDSETINSSVLFIGTAKFVQVPQKALGHIRKDNAIFDASPIENIPDVKNSTNIIATTETIQNISPASHLTTPSTRKKTSLFESLTIQVTTQSPQTTNHLATDFINPLSPPSTEKLSTTSISPTPLNKDNEFNSFSLSQTVDLINAEEMKDQVIIFPILHPNVNLNSPDITQVSTISPSSIPTLIIENTETLFTQTASPIDNSNNGIPHSTTPSVPEIITPSLLDVISRIDLQTLLIPLRENIKRSKLREIYPFSTDSIRLVGVKTEKLTPLQIGSPAISLFDLGRRISKVK